MLQGKKKKQPKNAFYFFMVHFRSVQEAKGVKFQDGLKGVADKAGPIWKVRQNWRGYFVMLCTKFLVGPVMVSV
jgi:hypothetical protein